ncbi:hypothetical protein [Caudoviricetes sp.]|nr:hypothetical protein [Caudoviricetes sp.]
MFPQIGQCWQHTATKTAYTILLIANERAHASKRYMYPVTIVYQSVSGAIWAKPYGDFMQSFSLVSVKNQTIDSIIEK